MSEQLTAVNRGSVNHDTEPLYCSEIIDFRKGQYVLTENCRLIQNG